MKRQSNAATHELVETIFKDENKKGISDVTPIIPETVADSLTKNRIEADYLVNRAEIHFQNSDHFKKAITKPGNKGRDNLYMFMDHWLKAYRQYRELKSIS